jgi:branched chain amino acid efflux pump
VRQSEIQRGVRANLPIAVSVAAYGSVLGVLAAQNHISWLVLLLMNLSIFAGSAQFVMVDMWSTPLPIGEMVTGVAVINLRYLLIGASLEPIFREKSMGHKAIVMHLVADENWAVTMAAHRQGRASSDFLFGGGCCLLSAWCLGTLTGHQLGTFIRHPEVFALDFAFIAVFTALTIGMWRGKMDLAPWIAAAVIAVAAEAYLPGKWYIVAGGLGGALVPALQCLIGDRGSRPSVEKEKPHVFK